MSEKGRWQLWIDMFISVIPLHTHDLCNVSERTRVTAFDVFHRFFSRCLLDIFRLSSSVILILPALFSVAEAS